MLCMHVCVSSLVVSRLFVWELISQRYQFITLMISTKLIVTLLLLLTFSLGQQTCHQLCSYNCSNGSCATCYPDFMITNWTIPACACPQNTFLNSTLNLCVPCPITCLTCATYSKCIICIPGFQLSNSFTCIPGASTANGWVSKEVSLELTGKTLTGSYIIIASNGTSVDLPQAGNITGTCSKIPDYNWLGGNLAFGYSTRIGKTLLGLPPHQWINVRMQAVLIDKWTSNTLLLEISTGMAYSPLWQGTFSSQNKFMDFCGDPTIPDNLAIVDSSIQHNASSSKIIIRLDEIAQAATSQLNQVFFAVRELFVRVGTCGKGCRYCAGPSNCTECILPYTLSQGTCVCNSTFGFVTPSGCAANCLSGYYYNATANSCLNCENMLPNCQTCNFTTCSACALGYFYSSSNSKAECVRYCPQGFTENRSTSVVGNQTVILDQCAPCPANCKTCNFNICLFCVQGYFYSQGSCLSNCPSTTYPNQGSCSRCPSNCLTCTATACSSCANGFVISINGCLPLCFNTTIVATVNSTCNITCASSCSKCYGSTSDQCLACSLGYLQETSCVSLCSRGYYLSNNQCLRCALGCQTCSNPISCITCTPGYYFVRATSNSNSDSCTRLCPSGSFPNVNSDNLTVCSPCATGCQRCKNADFCMECSEQYYTFNFTCLQTPPSSFYFHRQFRHFKPCQPNCLHCNQLVCYRCLNGFFLNQGACVTDCGPYKYKVLRTVANSISEQEDDEEEDSSEDGRSPQKTYAQYGFCQWRSPKCDVYDENTFTGNCQQCGTFEPRLILRSNLNNASSCFFNCPQFYTRSSSTCAQCPRNCRRCNPNMQCLECSYGYVINAAGFISNITNQTCILYFCPAPYFSDSVQCQKCVSGCSVCQMDGRCITCMSGFNISQERGLCFLSTCTSPSQYYIDASTSCVPCVTPCLTCIGVAQCTSCVSTPAQPLYLHQGSCVSPCPSGYFAHPQSNTCRRCNPKCATCLSFYQCLTCVPNYYLLSFYNEQQPQCVAECPIGFYSDTQRCSSCFRDCKSCYGPSKFQCLTCYPNFVLDQSRCLYKCSDNKYKDEYGRCDWCDSSCNECNGPTAQNCISCGLGYYISDNVCYRNECPGATYLAHFEQRICVRCQFGCSRCTSPQFCRFCFPGYFLYRGWCYQKCPGNLMGTTMRFLNLGNIEGYVCKECLTLYSYNCLRCSQNSCTKCAYGYYLYKNSQVYVSSLKEQCVSACPNGTYLKSSETRECVSCQDNCMNCVSYQSCTKCNYPYNLINGYCSTGCPAGTYLFTQTTYVSVSCPPCPSTCITCRNAYYCTSCQQNYYLFSNFTGGSCVSSCYATYFADAKSGQCVKCLPTCSACTATNNCTQCQSGFTLINGICQNQTTTCPSTTLNCQICSSLNCLKCVQPYLLYINRNTSVSSCVNTCPVGYFASVFTCQSCNSSCTVCFNSASNCSQCSAGRYLLGQNCVAVCPVGYYASSTTQSCQSCPSNCVTCQLSICYACQNGFFLLDGQCVARCPTGSYGSVGSGMCYTCATNCNSCSTDESCTSCVSGLILYDGTCLDDCPKTTFLFTDANSNSSCLPCQSPCFTCNDQTTCISCIPNYILNGTACQQACNIGYYTLTRTVSYQGQVQSYDFTNFTQCYPCDASCSICSTAPDACQACNQPYILYGTTCISSCPAGTFLNGTSCLSCPSSCLACTSANFCLICANNTILSNSQCISSCPNGYFIANQGNSTLNQYICQLCSPGCLTCSGTSLYQCLSCSNGTYLTPNGDCVSLCPTATYPNSAIQTCSSCRYGCSQCSSLANCTSCIDNYTLTSTNQCIYNSNCTITNCLFCSATSLSACAQCLPNYYLYNSTCVSSCPAGAYSQNGQCASCPSNCIGCSASNCLVCNTTFYLFQGGCTKQCPTGTYPSNGKCTSDACLVYNPSTYDCLQCANPYLLYNKTLPATSYLQICVLNCPSGTVQSGSTCQSCSQNCIQCLSPSICSKCTTGTLLYQGTCQSSCPIGTYSLADGCQSCTLAFCSQCVQANRVQSCTSCSASSGAFLANGACVLVCPSGTYASLSTMTCINCLQNCVSCSSAQSCSSCSAAYSLYLGQCVSSCPAGTYSNAGICSPCSSGCIQCISSTSCTLCQSTLSLLPTSSSYSCVSVCPNGQYSQAVLSDSYANSNQFKCVTCASPCLSCQSATSCTLCIAGYYLLDSTCVTSCPAGYFGVNSQTVVVNSVSYSSSVCNRCAASCLTCSNTPTYCLSCPSGYILDGSNNCVSNCLSPTSYYSQTTRICYNCSLQCYSCYGAGTDNCLSCRPPLQLFSGSCFSSCPFGYYPTAAYVCQPCASSCLSCFGSSGNCTTCASGIYLQFVNGIGSCSTSCPNGYFVNTASQSCTACNPICLSCSSLTQCSACSSGTYLFNQNCMSVCPNGTITTTINNQASCAPCPNNCASCVSSTSCTQCSNGFYLVSGSCLQKCPSGTYASPVSYACVDCSITGCLNCVLNSSLLLSCTVCQSGTYSFNGICVTACPNGTVPSGNTCQQQPVCQAYNWNGYCLSNCPTGTFPAAVAVSANSNTTNLTCLNCSSFCLTCNSYATCLSCANGTYLNLVNPFDTTCVFACPAGTYLINGTCKNCASPCQACQLSTSGINCISCLSGYVQLGPLCLTSCPNAYFQSVNQCLVCSPLCASCSVNATNCTSCKNVNAVAPACATTLNCPGATYQSSASSCSSCNTACLTCYGPASYECLSCTNNSNILLSGSCTANCPSGTIRNGTNCVNCPSNCQSCVLNGASVVCTACPATLILYSGACIQSCSSLNTATQSFIFVNNSQCQACTITGCLLCTYNNNQIQCTSCSNNTFLYNNQCISSCPPTTAPSSNTCTPCPLNCLTCTVTTCLSCNNGSSLLSGICVSNCGPGFYSLNSVCYKCSTTNCLNCNASSCINCQQPYALDLYGQCANCVSGYFIQGGSCQLCSPQCLTCSGTSSACTSCNYGYFVFNGSSCVTTCPSGYYATSTGTCNACSASNCQTCTSSSCSACLSGHVLVNQAGQVSCQSSCPASTFLSTSTNTCITCSSSCNQCTSSVSCTQCTTPSVLYLGYCLSSCPSGTYNTNQICTVCPSGCKTCISASNCTSCNPGMTLSSSGSCSVPPNNCQNGYFLNTLNSCSQCFPTCNTCSAANSNNCLTCFSGYSLVRGVCIQDCDSASFFNIYTSTCQLCSSRSIYCQSCNSSACLSCSNNYTVVNGSCALQCPSATFLSNGACLSCPNYCQACSSSSSCTQCLNSTFILMSGLCYSSCPPQTYLSGSSCASCYQTCITCSGSSTNCSSCITPYSLYGSSCYVTCPNGAYSSNYTCQSCASNCQICTGVSACTQCASPFYLINGTCRSQCPSGYFIDSASNRCLQCISPCLVCSSRNNCTSCQSPAVLNNGNCVDASCSVGAYFDFGLGACVNCTVNHCAYCSNSSCISCADGYYSIYRFGVLTYCQPACISSTYADNATMNCSSCFTNCFSCVNATWCSICSVGYYLLSPAGASANECVDVCPVAYYRNISLLQCTPCSINCVSCNSQTSCLVCSSNYYLLISGSNSTCLSNCPQTYFTPTSIDGRGQCGKCASTCFACVDASNCTQCISSVDVIVNGNCTPSRCVRCLTCNYNNNTCAVCNPGYYLFSNRCLANCPDGYYKDNSTATCTSCVDNCLLCEQPNSCLLCISGYMFVNGSACQNAGLIKFGTLGNMSGFTSNITKIMAIVYVSTSSGPIAFGAIGSTYGPMQFCQFLYLLQGSSGGNEEVNHFLNSLSAVSYTTSSGTNENSNNTTKSSSIDSQARLLTAINYTSSFLETNLPIFVIMLSFTAAYFMVLLVKKYNNSCCMSCPTLRKYLNYISDFMQRRFKYIYVDTVMWISYLPFLYFAVLQLQSSKFDTGLNIFSFLLAIAIIILYPLYPLFILSKIFDRSDNPAEDLRNYKAITLKEPPRQGEDKELCAEITCCQKRNPESDMEVDMVEMSLSPYLDKVVRPVYNQFDPEYSEFRYFKIEHWRLAYAPIKYVRKIIFVLIVALCPNPITTLALLIVVTAAYMAYLMVLRPKEKLYLILELLLESLLLFFITFMLVYLTQGGASVSSLSIATHAIGFLIANSALAIAIILNIMAYYTIFCCIVDLIRNLRQRAIEDDLKEKAFQEIVDDKQKISEKEKDKEDIQIRKSLRRGDDQMTVENNEDENYVPYDLDEKEFNVRSSMINKKKTFEQDGPEEDFTNLRSTKNPKGKNNRKDRRKSNHKIEQQSHTSEQIMGQSKVSQLDIEEGLIKEKNSKFKREVNKEGVNIDRGELRQPTDKFRKRHPKVSQPQEQQSLEVLRPQRRTQPVDEFVAEIDTHDRMVPQKNNQADPSFAERQAKRREKKKEDEVEQPYMREREVKSKDPKSNNQPFEGTAYDRQGRPRIQREDIQGGNMVHRERRKNEDPFGFNDPTQANPYERNKNNNNLHDANTYPRNGDGKPGKNQKQIEGGSMQEREKKKKQSPFGQFDQIFAEQDKKAVKQAQMKERVKKQKEDSLSNQKLVSAFLQEGNTLQGNGQAKKYQNLHYKGSDDEQEVKGGQMVQAKNKFRKGKNVSQKNIPETNIDAHGKQIKTKKVQRMQSSKDFIQDTLQEAQYRERQAKEMHKRKSANQKNEEGIEQATGEYRNKRAADKKKPESQPKYQNNNQLSPSPLKPNKRPPIYDDLAEDITQSVQFNDKPAQTRQKGSTNSEQFEQPNMAKILKKKEEKQKGQKDGRMQVSENLEQSYEDAVHRNKQQVFKQNINTNKSNLIEMAAEDEFEELAYSRPQSKIQSSKSRKDLGLGVNPRAGSEVSDNDSKEIRKQRNSAILRQRKKGTLNVNDNESNEEEGDVGADSRRISRIAKKQKSRVRGVLNIQDKSENEDIEDVQL